MVGVDVGASGIKGAIVNIETGELLTERHKLPTPKPATPQAMADTFAELIKMLDWNGPIGCGFPAIIKKGVAHSAANIDKSWIGTNVEEIFSNACGCPVKALNDADAAGLAEMSFGKGKGVDGVVLLITIGSGLGSALFVNGQLVPNSELGHIYLQGEEKVAEFKASSAAKKREQISYEIWGKRLNDYLVHLDRIFSPDRVILGGGISRKFEKYGKYLDTTVDVVPADLRNNAGSIGAALYAANPMF